MPVCKEVAHDILERENLKERKKKDTQKMMRKVKTERGEKVNSNSEKEKEIWQIRIRSETD